MMCLLLSWLSVLVIVWLIIFICLCMLLSVVVSCWLGWWWICIVCCRVEFWCGWYDWFLFWKMYYLERWF